jgi:hypothetical protein
MGESTARPDYLSYVRTLLLSHKVEVEDLKGPAWTSSLAGLLFQQFITALETAFI